MAFHNSGRIVTSGLVLSLDAADRNSYQSGSTTWNDLSGTGNNGSLVNGPIFTGSNGGNIVFDGVNDYVLTATNPSVSSQMTVEVWHKLDTSNITGAGSSVGSYVLGIEGNYRLIAFSGSLYSWVCATSNNSWYSAGTALVSTTVLQPQTWNHIVGTYDGTKLAMYINGNLETTGSTISGNILQGGGAFQFMQAGAGNLTYGKGNLAVGKIYNRALSAQEVKQNYDAMKSRFNLT